MTKPCLKVLDRFRAGGGDGTLSGSSNPSASLESAIALPTLMPRLAPPP